MRAHWKFHKLCSHEPHTAIAEDLVNSWIECEHERMAAGIRFFHLRKGRANRLIILRHQLVTFPMRAGHVAYGRDGKDDSEAGSQPGAPFPAQQPIDSQR